MEFTIKGRQGKTLHVSGDSVRIIKGGLLFGGRNMVIPIRSITAVELKRPGWMYAGFIRFVIAGAIPRNTNYGVQSAALDDNSILFTGETNYKVAMRIQEYVNTQQGSTPIASQS